MPGAGMPAGVAFRRGDRIESAVRPAGGDWHAPVAVSEPFGESYGPRVAVDRQGRATVVWTHTRPNPIFGEPNRSVLSAELAPGGTWQLPVPLSDPYVDADQGQVALDGRDNAVAAWIEQVPCCGAISIASSRRKPGGAWTDPAELGGVVAGLAELAVAPNGDAFVVWEQATPSPTAPSQRSIPWIIHPTDPTTIYASVRSPGGAWQPQVALSSGGHAGGPKIAVDPGGEAVVVWQRVMDPEVAVQSATFRTRGPPPPVAPAPPPMPPPPPTAPPALTAPPAVAGLRLARAAFRATRSGSAVRTTLRGSGSRVSYRLSAAARVRFTVLRASSGRRAGGRCVAPTARNRGARRCERLAAVRGGFSRTRPAGSDRFTFSGRVGGRTLGAGTYRLVATPTAGGRTGRAARAPFRIARRR